MKKEEAEQKAAEEKRGLEGGYLQVEFIGMENCQQRLLNVTLESEEN